MSDEGHETQDAGMKRGAAVSGTAHVVLIALALFGTDFFSADDSVPLAATDVTIVDATEFMARSSSAPVVENEGPADLQPPSDPDSAPATPETEAEPDRTVATAPPPPRRPTDVERPEIVLPPPPFEVPSEAPRQTIAEIPVPDELPFQAPTPESAPSTEVVDAQARAPADVPSPRPEPPPLPEEVPAEAPEPPPEEQPEPDPESTAATDVEAPEGAAPREARLPVARPARTAVGAPPSSETPAPEAPEPPPETPPTVAETESAPAPETPSPAPAGGNRRTGARMSLAETRGMSVSVRRYLQYQGDASDRTLRVVVRVELSEDGQITGGPELRSDAGESAAQRAALWQAARRALLRAAQAGEFAKLPRDKYEAWQVIDFVFTPDDVGPSS